MARRAADRAPAEADARLGEQFRDARDRAPDECDVAAARRLTRIRWRESMVEAALEKGELKLANDILDSIAKETSAKEAGDAGREQHEQRSDAAAQARERIFRRLDAQRERLAQPDPDAAAEARARCAAE